MNKFAEHNPSEKLHRVKVRLSSLTDLSPYVIHVAPKDRPKVAPETRPELDVNFLTQELRRPIQNTSLLDDGDALELTPEDHALLFQGDNLPGFASTHPFSKKSVVAFAALALLFVLPLSAYEGRESLLETKEQILTHSNRALVALKEAKSAVEKRDPEAAAEAFLRAEQEFGAAQSLTNVHTTLLALAKVVPQGRAVASGSSLLKAATGFSSGAAAFSGSLAALNESGTLTDKLSRLEQSILEIGPTLLASAAELAQVNPDDLPQKYPLETLKRAATTAANQLESVAKALNLTRYLLGDKVPRRYLVVFQNTNELRPTGGFIGSYALLDVKNGQVVNLEIPGGGSYDLQGQLRAQVRSPEPLWLVNARFEFQDANWFADFPKSALKLQRFYESSGGPTVDGVIGINSSFMEKLLGILGPLPLKGYNTIVDAGNFVMTAQRLAQFDYDREANRPKAFLGALAPQILQGVTDSNEEQFLKLAELTTEALATKDLQIALRSEEHSATLNDFGWDGSLRKSDGDYLALVNANIGGGKTDGVILENLSDLTNIREDGSVEKTVTLIRQHQGNPSDLFEQMNNVTYHRLYVPAGSILISASGQVPPPKSAYEIPEDYLIPDTDLLSWSVEEKIDRTSGVRVSRESGYTVFGAWSQVKPGKSVTLRFSYRLPFTVSSPEKSSLQTLLKSPSLAAFTTVYDSQSGKARNLERQLVFPRSWMPIWESGEAESFVLDRPRVHSILFKQ